MLSVLLLLLGTVAPVSAPLVRQSSRIIIGDPAPPPERFHTLLRIVDAVVVAEVTSRSPRALASGQRVTDYTLNVLEVVKADAARPTPSPFMATDAVSDQRRDDGTPVGPLRPVLAIGYRGVFLLRYWPPASSYGAVTSGFEVTESRVSIPAPLRRLPEFGGRTSMPLMELVDLIRLTERSAATQAQWLLPVTIEVLQDVEVVGGGPEPDGGMRRGRLYIGNGRFVIKKGQAFQMVKVAGEGTCTIRFENLYYNLTSCPWLEGFRDHQADFFRVTKAKPATE